MAQQWGLLEVWLRPSSFVWSCMWLLKDQGADPWGSLTIWLEKQLSGAAPSHPQPQLRALTGQGLSVLDLWVPQVLGGLWGETEAGREELLGISNKLVYSISANNLAHDLQNRSTHQIKDLHPSFGEEEDAMKQKNATNPVFIHTPGTREPDHTLTAQVLAS